MSAFKLPTTSMTGFLSPDPPRNDAGLHEAGTFGPKPGLAPATTSKQSAMTCNDERASNPWRVKAMAGGSSGFLAYTKNCLNWLELDELGTLPRRPSQPSSTIDLPPFLPSIPCYTDWVSPHRPALPALNSRNEQYTPAKRRQRDIYPRFDVAGWSRRRAE